MTDNVHKGLVDVAADYSAIAAVNGKSVTGLYYRGYDVKDLCASAECFEEVAYLLIYGRLPSKAELHSLVARLAAFRSLPNAVLRLLEEMPRDAHPTEVMRTGCSLLGALEGEKESTPESCPNIAERLMAQFMCMMLYWHHFRTSGRRIAFNTNPEDTLAKAFLKMLTQCTENGEHDVDVRLNPLHVRVLDVALILYAEHDLSSSTFAARIAASTLTDFHSAVCVGISTIRGPLHGGATEKVHQFLSQQTDVDSARAQVLDLLESKKVIYGFGHRIYKYGDPRATVFKSLAKELSKDSERGAKLVEISEAIEREMLQKRLYPNVDFYAATCYNELNIPQYIFTPIFIVARTVGWAAHVIEQRSSNRLIRPASIYNGPEPRRFKNMRERDRYDPHMISKL